MTPLLRWLPFVVFAFAGAAAASLSGAGPAPAQAFPELKVYDAAGNPWRTAVEDWEGARQRVAQDAGWADWLQQQRKHVDAWMAVRRDREEWACGWYHDFVSPKDASRLTWTPAVPGEEVGFLTSPSDPHVEITPKIMGAWVFAFRSRHAVMIRDAARLYRLTGDEKYASWAAAQIDFYAEHYRDWQPQRKDQGARLYWQTLDEATGGIKYIEAVRLLGDYVEPGRRQRWWENFFKPVAAVLDQERRTIHNIANWQRCAMAGFALVYRDEALWREAVDGPFGVREQIAKGITGDYVWFEQSFHYNEYVVEALVSLFTAAGLSGRAGELSHEMCVAENLMLAPLYVRFPSGVLPNPADGTGMEKVPNRAFLASTYRVFPTTLGLAEAAGVRSWDTLLDPPSPPPRAAVLPAVVSRSMENSRMALLKKGPWQVFLHYGQLTRSHAQSEALNFSASYGEADVTHDPGTVGYGSPYHKEYYTKGLNHNVPLIDGEGGIAPQLGELIEFSEEKARVAASQPNYQKAVAATRTLVIEVDRLIDTVTVRSKTGQSRALGLSLHVQGKARLPAGFAPVDDFAKGRSPAFGYWRNVQSATYTDQAAVDVDYGAVTLHIVFSVPGKFTLWHGSTPDVPPGRREGFYLETRGEAATFTTTFDARPQSISQKAIKGTKDVR